MADNKPRRKDSRHISEIPGKVCNSEPEKPYDVQTNRGTMPQRRQP